MLNAKCKMQNFGVRFADDKKCPKGIPQFCTLHSEFCIGTGTVPKATIYLPSTNVFTTTGIAGPTGAPTSR